MISEKYKQAFKEALPIFCVFILGAIAQLIMGTNISFVLKLLAWCSLYLIAINLHDFGMKTLTTQKSKISAKHNSD